MDSQSTENNQISGTNKKVIIVGAGPGGLSAGMLLASKGYSVHIYEKEEKVGGRNSFIKLGDYVFDIGPTFLMMKDVLETVFEKSGKNIDDFIEVVKLDPMYHLKFSPVLLRFLEGKWKDGRAVFDPTKHHSLLSMCNIDENL